MKNSLKKIKPWLPTIALLMLAAFAAVRMQTVQAHLVKEVLKKQDKNVYQVDKANMVRELDRIHKTLIRIEGKLDGIIQSDQNSPGLSGDQKYISGI